PSVSRSTSSIPSWCTLSCLERATWPPRHGPSRACSDKITGFGDEPLGDSDSDGSAVVIRRTKVFETTAHLWYLQGMRRIVLAAGMAMAGCGSSEDLATMRIDR